MDVMHQERVIKSAMAEMRSRIPETQARIVQNEALIERFPESAMTDFEQRLGSMKTLGEGAAHARDQLEDDRKRLTIVQKDYDDIVAMWLEVKDRELKIAMRDFWKRHSE